MKLADLQDAMEGLDQVQEAGKDGNEMNMFTDAIDQRTFDRFTTLNKNPMKKRRASDWKQAGRLTK